MYKFLFDGFAYRFFDGKKILVSKQSVQVERNDSVSAYAEAAGRLYAEAQKDLKAQEEQEGRELSVDAIELVLVRCGDASR